MLEKLPLGGSSFTAGVRSLPLPMSIRRGRLESMFYSLRAVFRRMYSYCSELTLNVQDVQSMLYGRSRINACTCP